MRRLAAIIALGVFLMAMPDAADAQQAAKKSPPVAKAKTLNQQQAEAADAERARFAAFIALAIVVGLASLFIYSMPVLVCLVRGHPDTLAISVMCVLFGWSFLGWGIALIWACKSFPKPSFYADQEPEESPRPRPPVARPVPRQSSTGDPFDFG